MSQISKIKEDGSNSINIADMLTVIFPNIKSKYLTMILRLLKSNGVPKSQYIEYFRGKELYSKSIENLNSLQLKQLYFFIDTFEDEYTSIETIQEFIEMNETKLIEKTDVTSYNSFKEIRDQVSLASLKKAEKELLSQIHKDYEDNEWLVIRPFSNTASLKYGYGTKWCTASIKNPDYFKDYIRRGVLIYVINKLNNLKVAAYHNLNEIDISFWNVLDQKIDSSQTGLPNKIIALIRDICVDINVKTNIQLYLEINNEVEEPEKTFNKCVMSEEIEMNRPEPINSLHRAIVLNVEERGGRLRPIIEEDEGVNVGEIPMANDEIMMDEDDVGEIPMVNDANVGTANDPG